MKRYAVLLMAALTMLLCSCSGLGINIADSISPPKPSGELYDIQLALEAYVGQRINLVYPSSGHYRSAIITRDVDGDGGNEAFSFYSTQTDDKTTVMHINYIRKTESGWTSVSDLQVNCSGVESVEFVRLDHSSIPKILVNWNRISAADKQLSVYGVEAGVLTEVTSADYTVYATGDFDGDAINDIVAVRLDTENKTSEAMLLSLGDGGFVRRSAYALDGTVTAYFTPIVSRFTDGTPAVFIDAEKSTGVITEVLYVDDGQLVSPFPTNAAGENIATLRSSTVRSEDFNKDGCVDIPTAQRLPAIPGAAETDVLYMTIWNSCDGKALTPIARSVINYTDGYYVNIPDEWVDSFTVERRTDMRQRLFFRWNSDTNEPGEEILRIQTVALKDWQNNPQNYENYTEITRNSDDIYLVRFGNSAMTPDKEELAKHFRLIKGSGEK